MFKNARMLLLSLGFAGLVAVAPASAASVTLTLLSSATAAPALTAALAKFHAANPGITINMSTAPDANMNVLLPQQLAAGNGADIFVDWPGIYSTQAAGTLAKNGFTLDLSNESWAQKLDGTLKVLSGYNGKIYFAPQVKLGFSTTYNQTALDKAGLKIPENWGEVLAFCKAASEKKLIPYALGAQTGSQTQMPAMAMGATAIDRDFTWTEKRTARQSTFSTSGWLTVFEKFKQLNDSGCFNKPLGASEDVARQLVASGRALGFFGPSSAFKIIQGMTQDKLVFTAFPATDDASATLLCVGVGSGLSVNAATQHPVEAKKFIAFMMEPENAAAYATATSQVPALPNDVFKATDVATSMIMQAIADGKTAPLTNQLWPNPTIVPAQRKATQMLLGNEATPKDVTDAMDQAWDTGT